MKSVLFCLMATCMMVPATHAQTTVNLPLPQLKPLLQAGKIPPATCWVNTATIPFAFVTGFDSSGNFVTGSAWGRVACGHSGRGSDIQYFNYCGSFVWDLSGNLVSSTVGVCPGSYTPDTFTNAGGYEAYTVRTTYYGYLQSMYPILVVP